MCPLDSPNGTIIVENQIYPIEHQAGRKGTDGGGSVMVQLEPSRPWTWPAAADPPTAGVEPSADLGRDCPVGTGEGVGGHHECITIESFVHTM